MRLSIFVKPAFALRSKVGLTWAEKFMRVDACCWANGWNQLSCTATFSRVEALDFEVRHLDRADFVVQVATGKETNGVVTAAHLGAGVLAVAHVDERARRVGEQVVVRDAVRDALVLARRRWCPGGAMVAN